MILWKGAYGVEDGVFLRAESFYNVASEVERLDLARSYGGSQFIIATHSPILMGYPEEDILLLGEDGPAPTPYEETEHYVLTRAFLQTDSWLGCCLAYGAMRRLEAKSGTFSNVTELADP